MLILLIIFQQTLNSEKFAAKLTEKRTNKSSLAFTYFNFIRLICFSSIILIKKKEKKEQSNYLRVKRYLDHKKNSFFCRKILVVFKSNH